MASRTQAASQNVAAAAAAAATATARAELLRRKIEDKRRLEKDSLRAVEALLEKDISEAYFIEQCRMLWQQSYQDCTEERAVGLLCGYPLCDNAVPPPGTKRPQYKICTRTNKVFKMENRLSFCSAWCYKASEWIKRQLSEVPHWMIEEPYNKPLEILKNDVNQNAKDTDKTQLSSSCHPATVRISIDGNDDLCDNNPDCIISSSKRVTMEEVDKCADGLENISIERKACLPAALPKTSTVILAIASAGNPVTSKPFQPGVADGSPIMSASRLEALLCEWITISTLHHIVGRDRFLELRAKFDKGKSKTSSLEQDEYAIKYERLCRFLDEQDQLEGITYDDESIKAGQPNRIRRKPRRGPVKKSVTFTGNAPIVKDNEIPATSSTATTTTTVVSAPSRKAKAIENRQKPLAASANVAEPVLPPVEKHQRHAARKQILLDRLTPIADELAAHLPMPPLQMSRALSELIDTLRLTKDNCMLRPRDTLVVFMVMLMLLDRRSGGEGTVPEAVREPTRLALNEANLSWGDLRLAIGKATDPERLFRST